MLLRYLSLLLFLFTVGCQIPLIPEGTFGKITDNEEKRLDQVLIWVELYQENGQIQDILITLAQNGVYKFETELVAHEMEIYFFTEKHGSQHEPRTTSLTTTRVFPERPDAYPKILYETHLEILDRISYWYQKEPQLLSRYSIQLLSNFMERHFYILASKNPEDPRRSEWIEIGDLYAAWHSSPEKIQNFPLIRLKLQEFLQKPSPKNSPKK